VVGDTVYPPYGTKEKDSKIPLVQSYLTVDFTLDSSQKFTAQDISLLKKDSELFEYW
jgi:hypothetical protein